MKLFSKSIVRCLLFSIPLIFLVLFYFFPLSKIFLLSFFPDGGWNPGKLNNLFSSPVYLKILWFTTWQAALSTILTLFLALPGAYVFTHFRFRGKNTLQALMTVPFVLPTVVTAAAFRALLGANGLLNNWFTSWFNLSAPPINVDQTVFFFLLAHIFYNYSLVLRIVSSFWSNMDPDLTGGARMLGASSWQIFRTITLPLLMPAIGSASLLVFTFCFTSFGIILILGGPGYSTIEVEIYRQSIQLFNLPMAAALSLTQIGINFLLMWLHAHLSKKTRATFYTDTVKAGAINTGSLTQKIFLLSNLVLILVLFISPLLALIIRSFTGDHGFTLSYYSALFTTTNNSVFFVEPISAVSNSVGYGIAAMTIAVIVGLFASTFLASTKGKSASIWDALIMLPLATSAVTLGFGYIITLNKPPLNLRDSMALVPIAHALVAFPFVVRCILPSLRAIPQSLREAATVLGATPLQVWRWVDIPIISRAILIGAIFAFSISIGEFGASTFITRPHTPTMPVAIFRFLSQPGEMNYGQAMAMSTILMIVTYSSFLFLGRLDKRQKGI